MKSCACTNSHSRPTDVLKAEHRVIERVLDALERFAAQEQIDAGAFRSAIDFLRNFADGCHHAKEENELFPRLEAAGFPRDHGPVGCMLDEHDQGRSLVQCMAQHLDATAAGDDGAREVLRAAADSYIDLLRKHIWKEDNVLFHLADRTLSETDQQALSAGFERTEQAEANLGKHERYLELADELHRRALELSATEPKGNPQ